MLNVISFYLLLIHSAVHSDNFQHQQLLAKQLINERCLMRNKTKSKMMNNYVNVILND